MLLEICLDTCMFDKRALKKSLSSEYKNPSKAQMMNPHSLPTALFLPFSLYRTYRVLLVSRRRSSIATFLSFILKQFLIELFCTFIDLNTLLPFSET